MSQKPKFYICGEAVENLGNIIQHTTGNIQGGHASMITCPLHKQAAVECEKWVKKNGKEGGVKKRSGGT